MLAEYPGVFAQTINPTGGAEGSEGLEITINDDGTFQVVRDGSEQISAFKTSVGIAFAVGDTTYIGNNPSGESGDFNDNPLLRLLDQSEVSGGGTADNPYAVTTTLYTDINENGSYDPATEFQIEWVASYVAPNDFFSNGFNVTAPAENNREIKLYQHFDSQLGDNDEGPAYGLTDSNTAMESRNENPKFIGVRQNAGEENEIVMGFAENEPEFSQWFSGDYSSPYALIDNGGNLNNNFNSTSATDNGVAIQYNLGRLTETETISNFVTFSSGGATELASNNLPTITSPATVNVSENTTTVTTITATDDDGDPLTYSLRGADRSLFNINSTTGQISFVNPPDFENPGDRDGDNVYTLRVTVDDGRGSTSQNLEITVTDVDDDIPANNLPTITSPATVNVNENTTTVTTITATDGDGDTPSYSLTGGADRSRFNINSTTGQISFVNPPDFENPGDTDGDNVYQLEVSVDDGNGGNVTQPLEITVTDVDDDIPANNIPNITSPATVNVNENSNTVITITVTDGDGDTPSYSLTGGADRSRFNINSTTGQISFVNPPDFENPGDTDGDNVYQLEVSVDDGNGGNVTQPLEITVTDVDEAPTISGTPAISVDEDSPYTFTPVFSDPDGDTPSFSIANQPNWAIFNSTTGELSGTPTDGDVGITENIIISVTDGSTSVALPPFNLTVNDIREPEPVQPPQQNQSPTATDENVNAPFETPIEFNLTDNITDPDENVDLTQIDLDPATPELDREIVLPGGTFAVNDQGQLTYSPLVNERDS